MILLTLSFVGLFSAASFAQNTHSILFPKKTKLVSAASLSLNLNFKTSSQTFLFKAPYYKYFYQSHGVMCRIEDKFSKTSKRPIRMRLGTVQYVDRLEGKY